MKVLKRVTLPLVLCALLITVSCQKEFPELPEQRSAAEQLAIDIEFIDIHLEENDIEAIVHSSGIRYVVLEEGTGASPVATSEVNVKYEGRFFSGVVFDSNDDGITFPLNQLIDAWKIMIPVMKEGGKITVYAPSGFCYGPDGIAGFIPADASLIFDIELIEVE